MNNDSFKYKLSISDMQNQNNYTYVNLLCKFVYLAQICLTLPKGSIGSLFLFQKLFYFIEMVGKCLNAFI